MSLKLIFIVCLAVILLGLITGGIFIWSHWQVYQEKNVADQNLVFTADQELAEIVIKEEVKKEEEEAETATSTLSEQTKNIIEESQNLIIKVQEFINKQKENEVLRAQALEKSKNVKGVYMTENIANSQSGAGRQVRKNIEDLIENSEVNAVVIDVKEAYGPNLTKYLKSLVKEYKDKGIWTIARVVVFRDAFLMETNPELYLRTIIQTTSTQATSTVEQATTTQEFWRDSGGGYWLDPSSTYVHDYLVEFSKEAIDVGFDELQFDYIRFPSDGKLKNIIYPFYNEEQEKYEVIRNFMLEITSQLREYKPDIILSVDIFGYVASQYQSFEIGQRTVDAAQAFDYISFMLYPSHFYGGFSAPADEGRGLPHVSFPYEDEDTSRVVSNNPYDVILRSLLSASDHIDLIGSQAQIRPWLQDFNLGFDSSREIYYDAEKIKAQIQATEDAGITGWLFWNPSNVYTVEAFVLP
ncbi:MAG: putative glycoside hydrolase [Candidatus Nealsonbacteria bacterium]